MSQPLHQVQTKPLRRAKQAGEFDVYRAALEWSLVDPIIINDREDLKSEARWHDRVTPFHHQVTNLITYCRRLPVTLLADDVGLGKTISAGLIASELISRRRLTRILIVAPKLLGPQWKEELETKFNIPAIVAPGKLLLDAEPDGEVGAVITTYHSAREYIKRLPRDRFQMLILDEAHKLRNLYGVPKPPMVAVRFREVLEERAFKFVLMLTATPIQNRLWDLYSLVDLLTVARGHQNPFGKEGMFARKFIADNRTQARQLRPEAKDQFRDIVYGYMSRVRRADAQLHFPDRRVFGQGVAPTPEEQQLIRIIAKPIQKLNKLAQISILQALTSSPDACALQLENMAKKGTFPADAAGQFRAVVKSMKMSAKLQGLASLVEKLKRENPKNWRMVVFTQRRETQTTIEAYLGSLGIPVGIINGETTGKNQGTIASFKASPPKLNVIVSTEAGSEGVNLQAANVLVNYDLPWNPMIVEQRIGRVQRLGSEHANVLVYSVTLAGTFEDYIVARLLQKLQMATHAIGDIESLLEASGMGDGEGGSESFEDQILKLVLDSLAGKDTDAATRAAEDSIGKARQTLIDEENNINEMLGAMDGAAYKGPRSPDLPPQERSMTAEDFVIHGLEALGAQLSQKSPDEYICEWEGRRNVIRLCEGATDKRTLTYIPGSQPFDQLISRLTQSGVHEIQDADKDPRRLAEAKTDAWVRGFSGTPRAAKLSDVVLAFDGKVLLHVRATVAHDSYERLISVDCSPTHHQVRGGSGALNAIPPVIQSPQEVGVSAQTISQSIMRDPGIAEFCRFYTERRAEEVAAAGSDPRMRKKLEDDFTPRLQSNIVGMRGRVLRVLDMAATYSIDSSDEYTSTLQIVPSAGEIVTEPSQIVCSATGQRVPIDTTAECTVTRRRALRHHLASSEFSGGLALPAHTMQCAVSGKRILETEAEPSAVTGRAVTRTLLKTSSVSGRRAEPEHFGRCEFNNSDALLTELAVSDVSGKRYRADQQVASSVSGRTGHRSEFMACALTQRLLLPSESERCATTGQNVAPGVLEPCCVSGRRVVPSELETSPVSGRRALRQYFVASSISGTRCLEDEAIRSDVNRYCLKSEAVRCTWSGRDIHPDEIRTCELTGVEIHYSVAGRLGASRLQPVAEMLNGTRQGMEQRELWPEIERQVSLATGAKCVIQSAQASHDGQKLVLCAEQRRYMGLQVRHIGFVYSIPERVIIGKIAVGKRSNATWTAAS
jgi:superfamily II DNA or RNA helicase